MNDNYEALRVAAEAVLEHRQDWKPQKSVSGDERDAVVGFVSLNSPETILALLSDLDTTRTALLRAEERMDAADELLQRLEADPYPASVFPKLTDADWVSLSKWCKSRGFPLDRLSGSYGRDFRNGIREHVKNARELLDTTPDPSKEA